MKKLKLKIKRRIEFQAATRGQAHIKQSKKNKPRAYQLLAESNKPKTPILISHPTAAQRFKQANLRI